MLGASIYAAGSGATRVSDHRNLSYITWDAAKYYAYDAAGLEAKEAVHRVLGHHHAIALLEIADYETITQLAEVAAEAEAKRGLDWKLVGMEAARASLRYVIIGENAIYSGISVDIKDIKTFDTADREEAIKTMLSVNIDKFGEMNLGGRCWYLSRIWSLMRSVGPVKAGMREKFFELVKKCNNPIITDFVEWITGPDFTRAEFLEQMKTFSSGLLPPLLEIVYDYLAPPAADPIRREILSLI